MKSKKPNFAKDNFGTDFLTSKAKKAFIHLQKAFAKALIFRNYNEKCYIQIETDFLGYTIGGIPSQMTSDKYFSGHIIPKDPILSKNDISQ